MFYNYVSRYLFMFFVLNKKKKKYESQNFYCIASRSFWCTILTSQNSLDSCRLQLHISSFICIFYSSIKIFSPHRHNENKDLQTI